MKLRVLVPFYENARYGKFKKGDTFNVPNEGAERYLESGALEQVKAKKKRKVN